MYDLLAFSIKLGERESQLRYLCINKYGFLGKYQFGKPRLWDMGISIDGWKPKWWILPNNKRILTRGQFLSNPKLQELTFVKHVDSWLKVIDKKYFTFIGYNVNGIHITKSGMVAGLHLKGEGTSKHPGLKQFLNDQIDGQDALGTQISEYVGSMGGFDLYQRTRFNEFVNNLV